MKRQKMCDENKSLHEAAGEGDLSAVKKLVAENKEMVSEKDEEVRKTRSEVILFPYY